MGCFTWPLLEVRGSGGVAHGCSPRGMPQIDLEGHSDSESCGRLHQVFGRLRDGRSGWDTRQFMEELARWRPDREIHIVWDNLNTHSAAKWEAFSNAHGGRFHFHYTPIHASWVNQVECFFSIFTRRVLRHASFSCPADFAWKARTFLAHWNQHEAKPFRWLFPGYGPPSELDRQRAA